MKKLKSILSVIILLVTFVLVITLVFAKINGSTPEIFGYKLLRISSPSMEPKLVTGDIILSRSIDDLSQIKAGDIITYEGQQGDYSGKLITHEVISSVQRADGGYELQTKGTANEYPDPQIDGEYVQGVMVCTLPVFSAIYSFFVTPWGLAVILGILAVLFINEAFLLVQLVKENRENEKSEEKTP